MTARSSRPDVRNPLLALEGLERFADFPPDMVEALALLMAEYEQKSRANGAQAWARAKYQTGSYWMIWAINLRHARVALRHALKQRNMKGGLPL